MKPYYEDDFVTLYHGDCLELTDVWTCGDVMVTDPPYGIGWSRGVLPATKRRGKAGSLHAHKGILNDANTEARDRVLALWGDRAAVVFAAWSYPVQGARQTLVWKKPSTTGVIGAMFGYRKDTEAVHLIGRHLERPVERSSVLETSGSNTDYHSGHPHSKPVPLLRSLIEFCPPGVIVDPFAGSGSTLRAAKDLGRKVIGVELEEKYCEIAAKRCAQEVLFA